MNATEILVWCSQRGIRLYAQDERIRWEPAASMTLDLTRRLKAHKPEILELLRQPQAANDIYVEAPAPEPAALVTCGSCRHFWQDKGHTGLCAMSERSILMDEQVKRRCTEFQAREGGANG